MSHHVLVIGGAGYVGSHVVYFLWRLGYRVTVLDALTQGRIPDGLRKWAHVVIGDCADRVLLDTLFAQNHISAVIHCAGISSSVVAGADPAHTYATYVSKTHILLDAARVARIRNFIFTSTRHVYSSSQAPLFEKDAAPDTVLGRAALSLEYMAQDYLAAPHYNYAILRLFNVAGAQPEVGLGEYHHPETHLVPAVLQAAYTGEPVSIFGRDYGTPDGSAYRDFVHVCDVADAYARVLHQMYEDGVRGCFNVGSGTGHTVLQVIACAEQVTKRETASVSAVPRQVSHMSSIADICAIENVCGWRPQYSSLPFILKSAWEWYLRQEA